MAKREKTQTTPTTTASTPAGTDVVADAYVFSYPLVMMDVTRRLSTAVSSPSGSRAPINQFAHLRAFPDASFTDIASPNADTLYSLAWLDLSTEPIVLGVPDTAGRYYLLPLLDAWTNVFASPGSRTTGNGKGAFAIVGPKWSGSLPGGLTRIDAPTNTVWIVGRTQTNGKQDYDAVHAIQDQYTLTPLSAWGKPYRAPDNVAVDPNVDSKTPIVQQVAQMDAATFFRKVNALMVGDPPAAADAAALAQFAPFGIGPGKPIDAQGHDPVLDAGLKLGQSRVVTEAKKSVGRKARGWDILPENTGRYGTDYLYRAIVAFVGIGANLPDDAVYPRATTDSSGQPLTGANKYEMHFTKDSMPPVNAFWSLTMYNAKQGFVDNPINRYAIGDRDDLSFADDGSLTLYVQHDSPGKEKEPNWLPAPTDSFNLFLRLYWPSQAIGENGWTPPAVQRA